MYIKKYEIRGALCNYINNYAYIRILLCLILIINLQCCD